MSSKKSVILLLGETGAGKSTLLNYIGNFFLGGTLSAKEKYSKMRIVIPNALFPSVTDKIANHSENNIQDKTKSQTSKPTIYPFIDKRDESSFIIVDTPGFGDTDRKKDETNMQNIFVEASQQPFISAIVLVINGSISRETSNLKFVLESMKGSVPNSLLNNVVIVLTNCDETTVNFDLKLLDGINTKNVFHMQNNAFSNDLKNMPDKLWKKLECEWEDSMDTLDALTNLCKKMTDGSAKEFAQMKMQRQNMQRVANEIIQETINLFQTIDLIDKTQMELKDAQERGETYKNFKKNDMVKVIKMVKTDYFSTVCQKHLNEKVCHEHCGLRLMESCNETHFLRCSASNGRSCKVCECSMSIHYHVYEIPKETEELQEVVIQDMKAKYDQANNDAQVASSDQQNYDSLKQKLESAIQIKKKELEDTCGNLKKLCSNFNFYEELKGIMENLEKEAKIAKDFAKKKEFESMSNAIKKIIAN